MTSISVQDFGALLPLDCDALLNDMPGWTPEDAKKYQREQHRATMVAFRLKKKQRGQKRKDEHRRLEKQMKQLAAEVRRASSNPSSADATRALRELVVEKEDLKKQNRALREEITRHEHLQRVAQEGVDGGSEKEEALLPTDGCSGWRVHFENGEPSFYFCPFTRKEFDTSMVHFDAELKSSSKALVSVGTFLGWDVQRLPRTVSLDGKSMARARFSKRIGCSLEEHLRVSVTKQKDLSPVVVTPLGWSLRDRPAISTQVLQQFDQDSLLFLHNIPGDVHLRYLFQLRRTEWKLPDGRRKLQLSLAVVDSDANRRSREAEGKQDNVEWFTEGGLNVSLTEIDDKSIHVVSDHWVGCHSSLHAEYMLVQWAQFAVWWEQMTAPTNLLL